MSSTDHAHLIRSCTYSADWLPQTPRFKDSVLEAMAEAGQGKTPTRSFYVGHQDALYGRRKRKSVGAKPYGEDCTDREKPRHSTAPIHPDHAVPLLYHRTWADRTQYG